MGRASFFFSAIAGAAAALSAPLRAQQLPEADRVEKVVINEEDGLYYNFFAQRPAINSRGEIAYYVIHIETGAIRLVVQAPDENARILAATRDHAPGFPPQFLLGIFDTTNLQVALNDSGEVAAQFTYADDSNGGLALYRLGGTGEAEVIQTTDDTPPGGAASYGDFHDILLNNRGDVCFSSGRSVFEPLIDEGIYASRVLLPGSVLTRKVIRAGDCLPGMPCPAGRYYGRPGTALGPDKFIDDLGDVAFLSFGRGSEGVYGVWKEIDGVLGPIMVEGEPVPPSDEEDTFVLSEVHGLHMNGAGQMAIFGSTDEATRAIWFSERDGALSLVAMNGREIETDLFTGQVLDVTGAPVISASGAVAFGAVFFDPSGFLEAVILWKAGAYTVVARDAPSAPGLPPGSGLFYNFRNLVVDARDRVLFEARAKFPDGVWVGRPSGEPRFIVHGDFFGEQGSIFRYAGGAAAETSPIQGYALRTNQGSSTRGGDRWMSLSDEGHIAIAVTWGGQQFGLFRVHLDPAGLVVNSSGGAGDLLPGDGECDTGATVLDDAGEPAPECTLRAAVEEANANPGHTGIRFHIAGEGPHTIRSAAGAIPPIVHPATIDGSTQPGHAPLAPAIVLDGAGDGGEPVMDNRPGLQILGGSCVVKGLAVVRHFANGIEIRGGGQSRIEDCTIGTDWNLDPGLGNLENGIVIDGSANNTIGGAGPGRGNIIAGNGLGGATTGCGGILVTGAQSSGNRILGNQIGLRDWGKARRGNGNGICLDAPGNFVGEEIAGAKNLLFNNVRTGVLVQGNDNVLAGNEVLQFDEGVPGPPGQIGIRVDGPLRTAIRGTTVAGQTTHGIRIDRGAESQLFTTVERCVVGFFLRQDPAGNVAIPGNGRDGIRIERAGRNVIGGQGALGVPPPLNVIAGNGGNGVTIVGTEAVENEVLSNLIGTDPTGRVLVLPPGIRVQPDGHGVLLEDGASRNEIGKEFAGNTISGNARSGVAIISGKDADGRPLGDTMDNVLEGNTIGLDVLGAKLPNGGDGVSIEDSPRNRIGGDVTESNVISGNRGNGVSIRGLKAEATIIRSNRIGTDTLAVAALGNELNGIDIDRAQSTTIGGPDPLADGNVVSANAGDGLSIHHPGDADFAVMDTVIAGNWIGTGLGGEALGNGESGVVISGASLNTIGPLNVISGNSGDGVVVVAPLGTPGLGNTVTQNRITGNAEEGIDLGADGRTPNDPLDADGGPNDLQNFPEVAVAVEDGPPVVLRGVLRARPSTRYTVEVFDDGIQVPVNPPEGATFLASTPVMTDPSGEGTFRITGLPVGFCYTATATHDDTGDTSEFSDCATVDDPPDASADFGDAPEPYPTTLAADGARHVLLAGFHLGERVDLETDGQPSSDAALDDDTGNPLGDEDGVAFPAALTPGEPAALAVISSEVGLLDAWIDFDGDGNWDDPGDQIFASIALAAGQSSLEIAVPLDSRPGATFARFRLSKEGALGPRGAAIGGEVEDYRVLIDAGPGRVFRRGDANDDGMVNISDAIFILGLLFLSPEALACEAAADANGDESVNISDPIALLNALFLGTGVIPLPGIHECGPDPTAGGLPCGPANC